MKYHQQKINLTTLGVENKVISERGRCNTHPEKSYKISKSKVRTSEKCALFTEKYIMQKYTNTLVDII